MLALHRLRTLHRRTDRICAEHGTPPVTILKPLAGLEVELLENLRSFVDQRYPRFQVIFGVTDPADRAVAIVERVMAEFPHADVSIVIGNPASAANPKVANLCAMIGRAKYDLLVIADADMRVDCGYLRTIVASFDDPRVGAATALYCGEAANNVASMLGAMYINEQFVPSVMVAHLLEPLTYCFGSTMAVRRAVLDDIGGLAALSAHIGDDYLLGKLVTDRGYTVALAPNLVRNIVYERNIRALLRHELRWARTIRAQRPSGYASLFLTQPLLCALLLLTFTGGSPAAWTAVAAALGIARLRLPLCSARLRHRTRAVVGASRARCTDGSGMGRRFFCARRSLARSQLFACSGRTRSDFAPAKMIDGSRRFIHLVPSTIARGRRAELRCRPATRSNRRCSAHSYAGAASD